MKDVFTGAIEEIVGRRVLGFTSQVLVQQGLAIEVFLLAPDEPPGRAA
jgi:uncharacterized protein YbcI